jgi:hypothetical protein
LLKMPYILRALLNPFTVMSMTKSYFASLFNIDYMKEEVCGTTHVRLNMSCFIQVFKHFIDFRFTFPSHICILLFV